MHQLLSEHTTLKFEIQFKFHSHTKAPESAASNSSFKIWICMQASIIWLVLRNALIAKWLSSDFRILGSNPPAISVLLEATFWSLLCSAFYSSAHDGNSNLCHPSSIHHPSIILKWRSAKIKNLEKTDDDAIGTLTGFENSKTENSWHVTKFLSNRQSWTQEWILSLPFCLPSSPPQMMCYGNSNLCHPLS